MKRSPFKVPLQTEVSLFIQNKMGWPKEFCDHYGDKFWNHYQASGWKLSNGNAIKDWQACFSSQWKVLKYKEDIELLQKLTGKVIKTNDVMPIEYFKLEAFLEDYKTRPTDMKFNDFGEWYDFMKENKLLKKMTNEDIFKLRQAYGQDNQKCRCAVVMDTLSGYVNSGFRIADVMKIRNDN